MKKQERIFIVGDLHGQFYDMIEMFIQSGFPSATNKYVFNDEYKLEDENSVVRGEDRWQAIGEPMNPTDPKHPMDTRHSKPRAVIGEVEGVLFVVYVIGTGDFGKETRIISARAADQEEVTAYFEMKYI